MEYRKQGNKCFSKKQYIEAIEYYTKDIEEDEDEDIHLSLSNRALSYYYLQDYSSALKDCIEICRIKSDWFKGWFRLSQTLKKMEKEEEAKVAYARYKELEALEKRTLKKNALEKRTLEKDNIKIIENNLPQIDPKMMNNMMKDSNMMNLASKLMNNTNIRDKIMNEDFKNKMLGNPNIMKNPMEMMNDKNFQEIFSETLKILQEEGN
tara:strand:+ start:24 stop:647 length:624 start_codon:yes stop_codon:yes gene_type:complete